MSDQPDRQKPNQGSSQAQTKSSAAAQKLSQWAWALVPLGFALLGFAYSFEQDSYWRDAFLSVGSALLLTAPIKVAERNLEYSLSRQTSERRAIDKARELMLLDQVDPTKWGEMDIPVVERMFVDVGGWLRLKSNDGMVIWRNKANDWCVAYPVEGNVPGKPSVLTTRLVANAAIQVGWDFSTLDGLRRRMLVDGYSRKGGSLGTPPGEE